mmetsp:Transcript_47200/g.93103  ORF Transcript_47200/g.93103 Transcript_47200/m.93103 type:complete len:239 (-) Transcript_47200:253-969(-)
MHPLFVMLLSFSLLCPFPLAAHLSVCPSLSPCPFFPFPFFFEVASLFPDLSSSAEFPSAELLFSGPSSPKTKNKKKERKKGKNAMHSVTLMQLKKKIRKKLLSLQWIIDGGNSPSLPPSFALFVRTFALLALPSVLHGPPFLTFPERPPPALPQFSEQSFDVPPASTAPPFLFHHSPLLVLFLFPLPPSRQQEALRVQSPHHKSLHGNLTGSAWSQSDLQSTPPPLPHGEGTRAQAAV